MRRFTAVVTAVCLGLLMVAPTGGFAKTSAAHRAALAHKAAVAAHKKHLNWVQRHPTLTGVGAGMVAYKMAKKTGQNRMLHGRKKNFAQRHPVMTGMTAAIIAHHYAKKSRKRALRH